MSAAKKILIDDLRSPVLTADQRGFLAEAENNPNPPQLTVEAVLRAAEERVGLHDFGPDGFRERLGLILAEIASYPNATALTRATYFNRSVACAVTRLQTMDLLRRHPEIHDIKIEQPIIIAGLPRSGTTHLLGLISADTRLDSLVYWESLQPIPLPTDIVGPDGIDPRYARAQAGWERLQKINPMMAPYHPMEPDHIHEDIELQMGDFASYQWEWMFRMPRWRDHYLAHDQTPHYDYGKTMLKILQWRHGVDRRWVLKAPQHIEQIRPILNVYPDALIVFTHRDPVASLQSIVTNVAYAIRTREKKVDPDALFAYWVDRVERLLRAYERDVDLIPDGRRFDVLFDDFMADDIAMVERIYEAADLPVTAQTREQFAQYMRTHSRGKYGAIDYDLRRDFGVDPDDLHQRYAFYMDAVGLKPEPK